MITPQDPTCKTATLLERFPIISGSGRYYGPSSIPFPHLQCLPNEFQCTIVFPLLGCLASLSLLLHKVILDDSDIMKFGFKLVENDIELLR